MTVQEHDVPDVKIIVPEVFGDSRGYFSEVYRQDRLREAGVGAHFIQDNQSLSMEEGTVRGLHFQIPPFAQAKLIRVLRGAIYDVAVDIRRGSSTYGACVSVEISAENWKQIYIPEGFAHGFVTLEPETVVLYKVSAPYSPDHERGIFWEDPALNIDWPVKSAAAILSKKDQILPQLSELPAFFP